MTEPCSSSSSPAPCTKAADSPRTPRPSLSLFHQWLLLTEAEQRVPGLHKLGRLPSVQRQNLLFCSVVTGDHSEARVLIPLRITSVLAQGSSHPPLQAQFARRTPRLAVIITVCMHREAPSPAHRTFPCLLLTQGTQRVSSDCFRSLRSGGNSVALHHPVWEAFLCSKGRTNTASSLSSGPCLSSELLSFPCLADALLLKFQAFSFSSFNQICSEN